MIPPAPAIPSGLDPHRHVLIAYAEMGVCNPLSLATIDRVLDQARLPRGARTLDLGCGNAAVSIHLAERHGLSVEAVERSPAVHAIARERLASLQGASVRLHHAASADFLPTQPPFDLIVAIGVSGVVEGPPEPARVIAALRPHLKPGGWLLWGDPFLKREPSDMLKAVMGAHAAYLSNAENVAAGESAGFRCWYAATSSEQDWDDYDWSINAAVERWAESKPLDPDVETVRLRARLSRTVHLMEGRETLGFGLYLFRAV